MKNFIKHFILITNHRLVTMRLCFKAGIPIRGLMHDLSKYSPTEFFEGVKYYSGSRSPISLCKKEKGYSKAWLHHSGRNKHHFEYWYDPTAPNPTPVMPYKYAVELVCDCLSASLTYKKKEWMQDSPLNYWNKREDKYMINPRIATFIEQIFTEVSKKGINKVIDKKNLKLKYKELVE